MYEHLIITVHGTWSKRRDSQPHWWQAKSQFCTSLKDQLYSDITKYGFAEFEWSGENSALERERASVQFTAFLRSKLHSYEQVSILAHSHGGNVVEDAILNFSKDQYLLEKLKTIVTFGTPFLKKKLPLEKKFSAISTWAGIVAFAFLGIVLTLASVQLLASNNPLALGGVILGVIAIVLIPSVAMLIWMLNKIFKLTGRLPRWNTYNQTFRFRTISHPNDEAINALKISANERVSFVKQKTIERIFIQFAKKAIILAVTLLPLSILIAVSNLTILGGESWEWLPTIKNYTIILFLCLFSFSIFCIFVGKAFAKPLSYVANLILSSVLKAVALGQDSEFKLTETSNVPFLVWSEPINLSEKAKKKMSDFIRLGRLKWLDRNAHTIAAFQLTPSRESLLSFSITTETSEVLIHNSYFEFEFITRAVAEAILQIDVKPFTWSQTTIR